MKKKVGLLLVFVGVVAIVSALYIASKKPDEVDFAKWMKKNYQIQCLDYNCETFQVDTKESKEPILMQSVHGGYSPGTFVMNIEKTYRNLSDSSYILDIKAEGYLGKIVIQDEIIKNIPRK